MGFVILFMIMGLLYTYIFGFSSYAVVFMLCAAIVFLVVVYQRMSGRKSWIRITSVLLIIVLLISFGSLSESIDTTSICDDLIEESSEMIDAGYYLELLELLEPYEEVMKIIPEYYINMGYAYVQLGMFDDYEDLISGIEFDHPGITCNTGIMYFVRGEYEDALTCFEQSLDMRNDYINARLYAGITCIQLERYAIAEYYLEHTLAIEPNLNEAHYWLAKVYYNVFEPEKARQSLLEAGLMNNSKTLQREIEILSTKLEERLYDIKSVQDADSDEEDDNQ